MVLIMLAIIASIISSIYYLSGRSSLLCFVTFVVMSALVLIFGVVLRIVFKNDFDIGLLAKRLICFCAAIFVGLSCVMINYASINSHKINYSYYIVTARIGSCVKDTTSGEYKYMLLDDLSLENTNGEKTNLSGKMKIFVPDYEIDERYQVGTYILFPALVKSIDLTMKSETSANFNNICDGVFYKAELKAEPTILDECRVTIFEDIKSRALSILKNNLEGDASGLAYAMIFGDTAEIEQNTKANYTSTGTAHLLAVSGLHVGFVVVVFTFLLKLLRADDKQILFIVTATLLLYLCFCNFATSIVRATIMTFCLLLAKALKKPYDSLSGLALAGTIILTISPLQFFDVGFRLSFMAVLGIVLLSGPISRLLSNVVGEKFSKAIAVTLSANLGTALIMITNFKMYSPLGIITNMIVVPFASLCYMFLFVSLMLSLVFPAIAVIVKPFGFGINIINNIIWFGSGEALAFGESKMGTIANTLYLVGMIGVSDYYLKNFKHKLTAFCIVAPLVVLTFVL